MQHAGGQDNWSIDSCTPSLISWPPLLACPGASLLTFDFYFLFFLVFFLGPSVNTRPCRKSAASHCQTSKRAQRNKQGSEGSAARQETSTRASPLENRTELKTTMMHQLLVRRPLWTIVAILLTLVFFFTWTSNAPLSSPGLARRGTDAALDSINNATLGVGDTLRIEAA